MPLAAGRRGVRGKVCAAISAEFVGPEGVAQSLSDKQSEVRLRRCTDEIYQIRDG